MIHEHDIRVYYEDTDAGGIVYNANYLKFFERARTELMRELGYQSSTSMAELGWMFVVTKVSVTYKRPAKLDDILTVKSHIEDLQPKRLTFVQNVWREGKIITEGLVELACMNMEGRGQEITKDIVDMISPYLNETMTP